MSQQEGTISNGGDEKGIRQVVVREMIATSRDDDLITQKSGHPKVPAEFMFRSLDRRDQQLCIPGVKTLRF